MSDLPAFVPDDIQRFYQEHWAVPKHGIPGRLYVAARCLVTDQRMEGIYKTLSEQGLWSHAWQLLFDVMVWPVQHMDETKKQFKDDAKIFREKVSQATAAAEELSDLLYELEDINDRSPDTCPMDLALFSPLRLLDRAAKLEKLDSRTRCLFEGYPKKRLDRIRGQFDLKYFPTTADLCSALSLVLLDTAEEVKTAVKGVVELESNKISWRDQLGLFVEGLVELNNLDYGEFRWRDPVTLRGVDFHNWVNVVLNPSYSVSRDNVKTAISRLKEKYPSELFLYKKQKK